MLGPSRSPAKGWAAPLRWPSSSFCTPALPVANPCLSLQAQDEQGEKTWLCFCQDLLIARAKSI